MKHKTIILEIAQSRRALGEVFFQQNTHIRRLPCALCKKRYTRYHRVDVDFWGNDKQCYCLPCWKLSIERGLVFAPAIK